MIKVTVYILFTVLYITVPKYKFTDIYDLTQHNITIKRTEMPIGHLPIPSSMPLLHENLYGLYDVAYFPLQEVAAAFV